MRKKTIYKFSLLFVAFAIVSLLVSGSNSFVYAQVDVGGVGIEHVDEGDIGDTSESVGEIEGTKPGLIPTLQNPLKVDSIAGLVKAFVEIFTYIVVLFAVLALIFVGMRFVTARGNPAKMTELKTWLFYIVIGVALVIGARVIVDVVIGTLEASKTVSPDVIRAAKDANLR